MTKSPPLACLVGGAAAGGPRRSARASAYPNRVIRFIVGFAAGGGNDIFARLVVQQVPGVHRRDHHRREQAGRRRADLVRLRGASAARRLHRAGRRHRTDVDRGRLYPNLRYHPTKSFIPLNMIASFPLVLVVPANHPAKNVKELVAWAKANPDKSNYGTSSPAFTIATELLKLKTGMPAVAIPFKGTQRDDVVRDQRAVPVHDFRWPAGDPADQGRQGARACGHRLGAFAGATRRAEHGGSGLP